MEYTTKYRLSKPTYDDDVDIQVLNNNMDIIDSKLQSVSVVDNTLHVDDKSYPLDFLPLAGGNITDNITVQNNQVIYATNTLTDENGNYYIEYSDGNIVCGGVFTDLNQGGQSGGTNDISTYAKRVNYLQPVSKTMIGFTAMILPSDDSSFWGNSSATALLRKPDTTGFYIETRSSYSTMLLNTSKIMWRAYFK